MSGLKSFSFVPREVIPVPMLSLSHGEQFDNLNEMHCIPLFSHPVRESLAADSIQLTSRLNRW